MLFDSATVFSKNTKLNIDVLSLLLEDRDLTLQSILAHVQEFILGVLWKLFSWLFFTKITIAD